jgi:ATP-dependent RNA helicase HelY
MSSSTFQPDLFQQKAIQALNEGASVLVAAPTGSGKTFIAEHAISEALSRGMKSFYTAPIKALSNQK